MPSSVLVVDAGPAVREIVSRNIDTATWQVVQRDDVDVAWSDACAKQPDLVVLNADLAKGWNLCTQLKKRFPTVPVVLLSYKANKELFNNHQKLPTRADAYHVLPDETDGLAISLGYFSSHKSEVDDEDSPRKARGGGRVAVPTGVVHKLEQTVREQARDLEGMRRQVEALEAERDAVTEKARRQMIELMSMSSGTDQSVEIGNLKRRIASLESDVESARLAARDAADRALAAQEEKKNAVAVAEAAQAEMIAVRSQSRSAGNTAEQIAIVTAQLAQSEQRRMAAESAKIAAEERALTAERAWSAVNSRAEELHQALTLRGNDVERVAREKTDVESTLATSRKLMKDYISEAARNAEAARVAGEQVKQLEARSAELQGEMEFQKALAESLEESLRQAKVKIEALEARPEAKPAGPGAPIAAESTPRVAELETTLSGVITERDGLLSRITEIEAAAAAAAVDARARIEALQAWVRKLEARLVDSETAREGIVARLQTLIDEARVPVRNGDSPLPIAKS